MRKRVRVYVITRWVGAILLSVLLSACAMALGRHEMLPPAQTICSTSSRAQSVKLYRQGEMPRKPFIRIAFVAADGNGYATLETLEQTLLDEAAKVGADCVIVTGREVTKDESIATYGRGFMIGDQIRRPHMYGVACRYAKVAIGVDLNKDGVIEYVRSGSVAQKMGLVEGMKILAVNGYFLQSDNYTLERELLSKEPGEKVQIEYLDKNGEKISKEVVLEKIPD